MAYYQCFKTINRTVYCSSYQVKNHAEGAAWVRQAMEHFAIRANELNDTYEKDKIPSGAIQYP